MRPLLIDCALLGILMTPLMAQTRFEAALSTSRDGTTALAASAGLAPSTVSSFPVDKGFVFRVACSTADLCKQVTVWDSVASKDLKAIHARDESAVELVYPGSTQTRPPPIALTLAVKVGDLAVPPLFRVASTAPEEGGRVVDVDAEPLAALLTANCPDVDWGRDSAFVVTALGSILHRPEQPVNEGSVVHVKVRGPLPLLPQLKVSRKSAFRPYRLNNIVSAGVAIPATDLNRQALTEVECSEREFELGDFAPGRGEVDLSVFTSDKGSVTTGSFDFTVNDLFTGAFAIGGVRTQVAEPSFQKVFNGTDTVVSVSDNDPRLLYVVTYTPFLWGPRDVRVSPPHWWHRVNPMIGIVLNSVPKNGLAGFSVDLSNRIYVQFGVHAGRVSKLDPAAGVSIGDVFENRSEKVPTVREWQFDWFYGVTVDLEAGLGLLKSVIGSSPGS